VEASGRRRGEKQPEGRTGSRRWTGRGEDERERGHIRRVEGPGGSRTRGRSGGRDAAARVRAQGKAADVACSTWSRALRRPTAPRVSAVREGGCTKSALRVITEEDLAPRWLANRQAASWSI